MRAERIVGASQSKREESEKQGAQYIDEVNKPQGSTQVKRNYLSLNYLSLKKQNYIEPSLRPNTHN